MLSACKGNYSENNSLEKSISSNAHTSGITNVSIKNAEEKYKTDNDGKLGLSVNEEQNFESESRESVTSSHFSAEPAELNLSIPEWERKEVTIELINNGSSSVSWSTEFGEEEQMRVNDAQRQIGTSDYDELHQEVQEHDSVHVIIKLDMPIYMERALDDQSKQRQRNQIANTQEQVIADVEDQIASVWQSKYTPIITAKVDDAGLEQLLDHPSVLWVKKDREDELNLDVSTELIGAPEVWDSGYTGEGQVVAILDAGIDSRHPHISDNVVNEACFNTIDPSRGLSSLCGDGSAEHVDEEGAACNPGAGSHDLDPCRHGTSVAGIAAGRGNKSGVAPDAGILAIAICSIRDGSGHSCRDSDQIKGKEYIYEKSEEYGYEIASINMSTGGGEYSDYCDGDDARTPIINQLAAAGIPFISSSGNDGWSSSLSAPACVSSSISVGSTQSGKTGTRGDDEDVVAESSNSAHMLDLLAPGVYVESPRSGTGAGYEGGGGTSRAAPHVAGAWALAKEKWPDASIDEVLARLKRTGEPITDHRNGRVRPRLQIDAAMSEDTWLATTPTAGRVSGGESKQVSLVLNATDLAPGQHEETVRFVTTGGSEAEIDLNIEVTEQERAQASLNIDDLKRETIAGNLLEIEVDATNVAGEAAQSLELKLNDIPDFIDFVESKGDGVISSGSRIFIDGQSTASLHFSFNEEVQGPTSFADSLNITTNDPESSDMQVPVEIDVRSPLLGVSTESILFRESDMENGEIVSTLAIDNPGNSELNGELKIVEGAEYFSIPTDESQISVEAGEEIEVELTAFFSDEEMHTGKLEIEHDAPNIDSPMELSMDALPDQIAMQPNYPNPFNDQTTIEYSLPEPANVLVDVYDAQGRRMLTLEDGHQEAGVHQIQWNGEGNSGHIASGTYFIRLLSDGEVVTQSITLLK